MSFARVRALVVVGVLAVAAVVFVVVALVRDTQGDAVAQGGCPDGSVMANVTLPESPQEVTIKVLNGTGQPGLAENVSNEFKNRQFKTQKPGENKKKVDDVAIMRYGPDAVGSAWLLRAYFLNQADTQYDAKRKGAVVDIVIGNGFQQLATTTEVNQSLVELGEPELPPGACAAPAKKDDDKS
ncbi:LytR C-terminal domain-containing protein [Actinoplanes sp. RD1]|uniref:LytR C-terminal domain-containing protein n=1 Tax=Actinoplanes sp. RD1 TaxID=3064538 RepID=UPI00274101BA|nr:LytR C-terminal domain-containing protein [Actinoplanes sp. RD1]